jgi:hypothetical protein
MKRTLKTTPLRPRRLVRVTDSPADIDPALWNRSCELWASIRWEPLNSTIAVSALIPLVQAYDEVELLRAKVAKLEAAAA